MDSEIPTSITGRTQEKIVPEKNALDYIDKLFYVLGKVTRPSKHEGIERSLALRTERALLYKKIKQTKNAEEKRQLTSEAQERDKIFKEYLQQGEVLVNLGELGKQVSRYIEMNPPESRKDKGKDDPPVVIIAGLSNDIDCVGALTRELPYQGRKTFMIGYPESFMGRVTPEFVEAVKNSPTYEPHTTFYKAAINKLLPYGDIELWGYSNGGPIAAQMLNDKEFSERVSDAVLISPASVVDQSVNKFMKGAANEFKEVTRRFEVVPKYTLSIGKKGKEDQAHLDLRKKVAGALLSRVLTKMDLWKKARVKEGGAITIVSPLGDNMTNCHQVFNKENENQLRSENPQIRVLNTDGTHVTALIDPAPVLEEIKEIKKETI